MRDLRARLEDLTREGHEDQLLTKEQAAELLQIRPALVYKWGLRGKFPRVMLSPQLIRYRESDIRALIRDSLEERVAGDP